MTKIIRGKILKLKMKKTAVVGIEIRKAHPLYKKIQKRTIKLKAHYEGDNIKIGDNVSLKEVKPISKTKNWIIIDQK